MRSRSYKRKIFLASVHDLFDIGGNWSKRQIRLRQCGGVEAARLRVINRWSPKSDAAGIDGHQWHRRAHQNCVSCFDAEKFLWNMKRGLCMVYIMLYGIKSKEECTAVLASLN